MASSRRHDSLIPLSREHHYALMLCLRLHRGLPIHQHDDDWLRIKRDQTVEFFDSDLTPHFRAEEEVLFPAMRNLAGADALLDELLSEHDRIRLLIRSLRDASGNSLATALNEVADLLESHIRKEERQLFPIYERQASVELARSVGEAIAGIIGEAMRPKNPDLLK
jgi:iron-sulfur cluster repair protein YtfE (RIC family)